jgi:hypothetical protein
MAKVWRLKTAKRAYVKDKMTFDILNPIDLDGVLLTLLKFLCSLLFEHTPKKRKERFISR